MASVQRQGTVSVLRSRVAFALGPWTLNKPQCSASQASLGWLSPGDWLSCDVCFILEVNLRALPGMPVMI